MFGVGHDHRDPLVENVPHRNPIRSRALHDDRRACMGQQPLQTPVQLLYGGAEGLRLLHRFDLDRTGQDGYRDLALADVDTGTALQKLSHASSCSAERRSQRNTHELCFSGSRAPSSGSLSASRTSLTSGVGPPHRTSAFPGLRAPESTRLHPPLASIFMASGVNRTCGFDNFDNTLRRPAKISSRRNPASEPGIELTPYSGIFYV